MKALLLKDWYVLTHQLKLVLAALVMFALVPMLSSTACSVIFVILLPVSALSYDEHSHWDQLAAGMPYTVPQLVVSKYLFGYLGAACIAVLSLLSHVLFSANDGALPVLLCLLLLGLLMLALVLPVLFRFGVERGRLVYVLVVALSTAAASILPSQSVTPDLSNLPMTALLLTGIAAVAALNALSIALSIRFYEKKRG